MKRGGVRPNSGRKPKADEIKLIESMDAILAPEEVWQALANLVLANDPMAIKTWLAYRYGQPKQQTDITTNGKDLNQPVIQVLSNQDAQELNKV
jgi:hypothetical protein